jgi:hypothetical protein
MHSTLFDANLVENVTHGFTHSLTRELARDQLRTLILVGYDAELMEQSAYDRLNQHQQQRFPFGPKVCATAERSVSAIHSCTSKAGTRIDTNCFIVHLSPNIFAYALRVNSATACHEWLALA